MTHPLKDPILPSRFKGHPFSLIPPLLKSTMYPHDHLLHWIFQYYSLPSPPQVKPLTLDRLRPAHPKSPPPLPSNYRRSLNDTTWTSATMAIPLPTGSHPLNPSWDIHLVNRPLSGSKVFLGIWRVSSSHAQGHLPRRSCPQRFYILLPRHESLCEKRSRPPFGTGMLSIPDNELSPKGSMSEERPTVSELARFHWRTNPSPPSFSETSTRCHHLTPTISSLRRICWNGLS